MSILSRSVETLFPHCYIVYNLTYIFLSIILNIVCLHANSLKHGIILAPCVKTWIFEFGCTPLPSKLEPKRKKSPVLVFS